MKSDILEVICIMDNEVKKIPCKNECCNRLILEVTAKKTGGYCYPCYNYIEGKKREEYIRKNKRTVNLYEGIHDPVEMIKIMGIRREYNPLIEYVKCPKTKEELYSILTKDHMKRLKEIAMESYKSGTDQWEDILLNLVCFNNADINGFLKILINDGKVYESSLFKNASDEIADMLIDKLECNDESISLNHILLCLAMIGNERVVELFNKWKKDTPEFAEKLYVKPHEYSYEGGWKLDENGNRKDLYYHESYGVKEGVPPKNASVKFYETNEDKCKWCGRYLDSLFTIDLKNKHMEFLGVEGDRLNISTCSNCTCYGYIYTDIDTCGHAHWSSYNSKPNYLDTNEYEELDEIDVKKQVYVDNNVKSENYGANQFLDMKFTKIGGMPTWIQDAEYPKCPKCGEEMMFVGQLSNEDFEEYAEGIYYGFVCKECMIAATTYQQT